MDAFFAWTVLHEQEEAMDETIYLHLEDDTCFTGKSFGACLTKDVIA